MAKLKKQIKVWISQNKLEFWLLLIILGIGSFMRLYKIGGYMTFLGDEGRDAIIVRRLLVNGDPILIGPGTSIGNMYIGPLYYYLIAPALLLANFSPVGPSILVALIGIVTIFMVYLIARNWFGKVAGLVSSFLYAIAPTVIIFSRASWNPNVMPFFALLCIWSVWKFFYENKFKWIPVFALSFAFMLQSHWLGLLIAPTAGIYWLLKLYQQKQSKNLRPIIINTVYAALIFAFLMSPLVIFDFRHEFLNFNAIKTFFTVRQTTVSVKPWKAVPNLWPLWEQINTRLLAGRNQEFGKWVALILASSLLWLSGKTKFKITKRENKAFLLIFLWLLFSLLGLGIYKQHIYDHYFGIFFPALFLLLGGMLGNLIETYKLRGTWLALTFMVFLTYFNLIENPHKHPPVNQLTRTEKIADLIAQKAGSEDFNIAVIAERNYEDAYQYFLEKKNTQVVDIDPLNADTTITNQLFVVCEMEYEKCDPTHNSKAQVANFGWSKIEDEWNVDGITIFKLIHTQE